MFAVTDRGKGGYRMSVIGGRDEDGINILRHGIKHFPEILKAFGVRKFLEAIGGAAVINITEGHNVFPGHRAQVPAPLTSAANDGETHFVGRRFYIALGPDDMSGNELKTECGCSGFSNEGPAFHEW